MPNATARILPAVVAMSFAAGMSACQSSPEPATPVAPATSAGTTGTPVTETPAGVAPKVQATVQEPKPTFTCPDRGGTEPVDLPEHATAELYLVTVARRVCDDRVVFRVNGEVKVGGHAQYVPRVRDLSGALVAVRGDAVIEVVVYAPDFGQANSGHQPGRTPWRIGQEVARVPDGWPALREVAYAGPNDGSETVFAVGVSERLPFTLSWRAGDGYSELTLEIAH
ncbi:AMIN-like domain-containing (lipo)protein [Phytohabitans rumicis]|uniref:AMIN-like domain-containing protein n=1 Tax=Phytohabitans rumicis TaxID=1076125 RepID=A0A6V8L3A8_9ACTN|nr:hypothetical protein [Phytohabitans rumicis]GFJ91752.1 hypothetical protein Prum_053940 [Phytohabitans rumicis]